MKTLTNETQSATRLEFYRQFDDGSKSSTATSSGFFWRQEGKLFVVTCWHCLSGKNPNTGEPLGSFTPNTVVVHGRFAQLQEDFDRYVSIAFNHEIRTEAVDGSYLWHEHRRKAAVDVCAIELDFAEDENNYLKCLNEIDFTCEFAARPATDAFIVGFPEGFSGEAKTPIYKRATVASEPQLDFDGQPVILIDCIGNSGLSGAPVIIKGSGILENKEDPNQSLIGSWENLLGVYSGRMNNCGIGSQLGRVWKIECVYELFESLSPRP